MRIKTVAESLLADYQLDNLFVVDVNGNTEIHDRSKGKRIWSSADYTSEPMETVIDWTQRTVNELLDRLSAKSDNASLIPNTYESWYNQVNLAFRLDTNFDLLDVADQPFRDWFDDGMSVDEAVLAVKENIDFPM